MRKCSEKSGRKRDNPIYEGGSKSFELGRFFCGRTLFYFRRSFLDLDVPFYAVRHAVGVFPPLDVFPEISKNWYRPSWHWPGSLSVQQIVYITHYPDYLVHLEFPVSCLSSWGGPFCPDQHLCGWHHPGCRSPTARQPRSCGRLSSILISLSYRPAGVNFHQRTNPGDSFSEHLIVGFFKSLLMVVFLTYHEESTAALGVLSCTIWISCSWSWPRSSKNLIVSTETSCETSRLCKNAQHSWFLFHSCQSWDMYSACGILDQMCDMCEVKHEKICCLCFWSCVCFRINLLYPPSKTLNVYDGSLWCEQSNFLLLLKMSTFVPNKVYLRGISLHYFIQNKSAAETHGILVETYGNNALSDTPCRDWFRRFKNSGINLRIKNVLAHRKNLKTKNWRKYSMKTDLRR